MADPVNRKAAAARHVAIGAGVGLIFGAPFGSPGAGLVLGAAAGLVFALVRHRSQ